MHVRRRTGRIGCPETVPRQADNRIVSVGPARIVGWSAATLALLGAGLVVGGPPPWLLDWLAGRHPGCLYRIATAEPIVALTLDAVEKLV